MMDTKKIAGSGCEYGSSRSCFKNQVIITRIHTNQSKEAVIRYMNDCKKTTRLKFTMWIDTETPWETLVVTWACLGVSDVQL